MGLQNVKRMKEWNLIKLSKSSTDRMAGGQAHTNLCINSNINLNDKRILWAVFNRPYNNEEQQIMDQADAGFTDRSKNGSYDTTMAWYGRWSKATNRYRGKGKKVFQNSLKVKWKTTTTR